MKKKRLSKSKRNRAIKNIVKEGDRFDNRNKLIEHRRQNTVRTKSFRTPQTFGPASEVRHIKPNNDKL